MKQRICSTCGEHFLPKEGGHNAKYCSGLCRNRAARVRTPKVVKHARRKRAYERFTDAQYTAHLATGKKGLKKVRVWLFDYKQSRGCVDCGYDTHPAALQLDHTGQKTAEIANLRTSRRRLLTEIESGKCVVRCANCHSVRTWAQKNGVEYQPSLARHRGLNS